MAHDLQAWRAHTGGTAWPTVALAVVACGAWLCAVVGHAVGAVPTEIAAPLALVAAYVSFTPLHEATHGNVGGRTRPWLDAVVGWASSIPLLAPYPAFRALHLRHHAKTNDPELDPDIWVAGAGWRVVARCLTILPHYYQMFLGPMSRESSSAARNRTTAIVYLAVLIPSLVAWALAGWASTVLAVVVAPAWLASGLLALVFDWLPHHPHAVQGRFVDTRVFPSFGLEMLMLGQNLHLVHHLWPSVPFYRYGAVFAACRDALAEKAAHAGREPVVGPLDGARVGG